LATWPEARARFGQRFPEHTRQPARRLEWSEALSYCEWFTEHCRGQLPSHLTATLPTEAQWEYACRGGTETEYFSGDGPAALSEVAWYFDNAFAAAQDIDKSVQKHTANRWGLVDMHGSVWEWCHDIWDEKAYSKRLDGCADPLVSLSPSGEPVFMARRVVRGGSYLSYLRWCRATYRIGRATDKSYDEVGFRVCLSSNPPANTDRSSLEETLRLLYRDRELARKPG
jgi:formylglycine-generating enzyme required for sulfatase activity